MNRKDTGKREKRAYDAEDEEDALRRIPQPDEDEHREVEDQEEEDDEEDDQQDTNAKSKSKKPTKDQDEDEKDAAGDEEDDEEEEEDDDVGPQRSKAAAARGSGLVQILPYLFIGDAHTAQKSDLLRESGITHIINCVHHEVDNLFPELFEYTEFEIPDDRNYKINKHFPDVYQVVAVFRDNPKDKVLIHCDRGQSQSIALVLAYILKSAKAKGLRMTLKAAITFVQQKKMNIKVNDGFMRQLVNLEKELFGDSSIRVKGGASGATGKPKRR